jgi:hypothetical protein
MLRSFRNGAVILALLEPICVPVSSFTSMVQTRGVGH